MSSLSHHPERCHVAPRKLHSRPGVGPGPQHRENSPSFAFALRHRGQKNFGRLMSFQGLQEPGLREVRQVLGPGLDLRKRSQHAQSAHFYRQRVVQWLSPSLDVHLAKQCLLQGLHRLRLPLETLSQRRGESLYAAMPLEAWPPGSGSALGPPADVPTPLIALQSTPLARQISEQHALLISSGEAEAHADPTRL